METQEEVEEAEEAHHQGAKDQGFLPGPTGPPDPPGPPGPPGPLGSPNNAPPPGIVWDNKLKWSVVLQWDGVLEVAIDWLYECNDLAGLGLAVEGQLPRIVMHCFKGAVATAW
jgi:hypothetical protein